MSPDRLLSDKSLHLSTYLAKPKWTKAQSKNIETLDQKTKVSQIFKGSTVANLIWDLTGKLIPLQVSTIHTGTK